MQKFPIFHKKASIDVQFNWIFVLIIGALIIVFFISVMKTSEKSSTKTTYQSISLDLKNIFSQTELDIRNSRTIKLPNIVLNFNCEDFEVEKSSSFQEIKYKTIFSPNKILGREILTYTKPYNMPYPVDYFVFMTSNQIRYNFVKCDDSVSGCETLQKELIKMLPVNSTVKKINAVDDNIKDDNYYKERFIFIGTAPTSSDDLSKLSKLNDKDVTAIYIQDVNMNTGTFSYYEKNGNSFESLTTQHSYLGIEMLAGAVISDPELYDCNVNKTLSKFKILTTLYSNRTNAFKKEYSKYLSNIGDPGLDCFQMYNTITLNPNITNFNTIFNNADNLKKINNQLILISCPLLY